MKRLIKVNKTIRPSLKGLEAKLGCWTTPIIQRKVTCESFIVYTGIKIIHGVIWNMTTSIRRRHVSRDQNSIIWQFLIGSKNILHTIGQNISQYRFLVTWNMPSSNAYCHISYNPLYFIILNIHIEYYIIYHNIKYYIS